MMGNNSQDYVSEAKEQFIEKDLNSKPDGLSLTLQKTHLALGNEDAVNYDSIYKSNYEEKQIPDKVILGIFLQFLL